MKRFALILLLPLAFACKTQEESVEAAAETEEAMENNGSVEITTGAEEAVSDDSANSNTKPQKPYDVKATVGNLSRKSDSYTIREAYIEGNDLMIDISYSGGCARHTFEFVGSPAVSKSLPPQRAVKLIHDNGDDMCESMVDQTIRVDISDLAMTQTAGSQIKLNLEGYSLDLLYIFE